MSNNDNIDELIKLASLPVKIKQTQETVKKDNPTPKKKKLFLDDALKFVTCFEITEGPYRIRSDAFYLCYKKWAKDPATKASFFQQLAKYFEPQKDRVRYYKINYKAWELELKIIETLKNEEKIKKS